MSEKNEYLSKKALLTIGITSIVILIVGVILYYTGFNETFYSSSSTVRAIFSAITYLGEPVVFIIIVAILFIGYNKRYAKNIAFCLLFSTYFNGLFKELGQDPRPPTNVDPAEDYGLVEVSYGFPSGHSQTAVSFWGYLGYEFDEPKYQLKNINIPIIPFILSVVIFLVAISRIIIGVHDLQDIIGGLLIGIGLLLVFIYAEPIFTKQWNKLTFIPKLILVIVISLAAFLIGTFLFPRAGYDLANITGTPPLYPDAAAFGQVGGVTLGFGVGYILEQEYIKYDPSVLTNKQKILNVIIGLIILVLVFIPLEYLLEIDSAFYRFARYALTAFILAVLVPFICVKLNKT
jgi:membrane-associated phospholipid phosphatase